MEAVRPAVRHRAALAALFAATACLDPTQATIEITTDIACGGPGHEPATLFDVVVSAGVPGSALGEAVQTISDHCEGGDIGSVVVVPRAGEPRASVLVVGGIGSTNAEACLPFARGEVDQAPECVVARRTVAFVDHTPLRVPVRLFAACAGVRCAEDRTCVPGAPLDETGLPCVSAEVECRGAVCTVGGGGEVGGGGVGGGGVGGGGGGVGGDGAGGEGAAPPGFQVLTDGTIPLDEVWGVGAPPRIFATGGAGCAQLYELVGGALVPLGACQGNVKGGFALHALEDGSSTYLTYESESYLARLTLPAVAERLHEPDPGQAIVDAQVIDEDRTYGLAANRLFRWSTLANTATFVDPPPPSPQLSASWTDPANPGRSFAVGGAFCRLGGGFADFCHVSGMFSLPPQFLDVWGSPGDFVVAVGFDKVVTYPVDGTEPLGVDLLGGGAFLTRVHVSEAGQVWVGGTRMGVTVLATGVPGGTWTEHTGAFNGILSLWASEDAIYFVTTLDQRLVRLNL